MKPSRYQNLIRDGLWKNNQGVVALLGLCPFLAVSNTAVNSLGLGIATTLTLVLSNAIVSLLRNQISKEIRLPVFVLVIATIVTLIELAMHAYFYELYKILGIFVPLIVTNCAIIGRAEAFAARNSVDRSIIDGLFMGLGFTLVLVLVGAVRELIGSGTLFAQADLLFGDIATDWSITLIDYEQGFLLAILPPGAFICVGFLIAIKNVIDANRKLSSVETKPITFRHKE